jgi:hypothetical protein
MRIYVYYQRDVAWKKKQLDTDLMFFEGKMFPDGRVPVYPVSDLSDLGYVLEEGKTIFVLREPMEFEGTKTTLKDVEFNVDFLINSSKILFIEPYDDNWRPMDQENPPDKKKRKKAMEKLSKIGGPR